MKKVFVTYGANHAGVGQLNFVGNSPGTVNGPSIWLSVLVWDNNSVYIYGEPENVVRLFFDFEDDNRDIEKKIINKMIVDYGVTKHDVIILG